MIDFEPTEEQQLIIETVQQFAQNEIRLRARDAEEAAKYPSEVLSAAHELGLVANALPEAFGGGGERSAVTGALIAEELAWGDLALALGILAPSLAALPILDFGTEEQKRAILPGCVERPVAPASLALVEPRYDFDPFRPATTAKREGDGLVLDGSKCMVPWLEGVDSVLVSAMDAQGAQLFHVPADAKGLSIESDHYMGIRALPTVSLTLDRVHVPQTARIGAAAGCDLRALINRGRVGLAACAVGVSRAAFELSRDYAKERHAFGVPIATKQAIAFKLADMAIEIDGLRLLTWEAAVKLDLGEDATREAMLAIDQARRVSLQVTDGSVQVFGGHGYVREYLPELLLRNARGFASFEALTLI